MQLIEIDPVEAQPPQAPFARRLQMFRPSVFNPLVRARPLEATLRRDDDAFRIGIQSLSNDSLADIGAACESAVSMKLTPSSTARLTTRMASLRSGGFAPDSLAGEPHRTQSEPSHEEIVADQQFAAEAGRLVFALP